MRFWLSIAVLWIVWLLVVAGLIIALECDSMEQVASLALAASSTPAGQKVWQEIIASLVALGTAIIGAYVTITLKRLETRSKKIDEAVNNRHHYRLDENGNPLVDEQGLQVRLSLNDLVKDTHDAVFVAQKALSSLGKDVSEAKLLAENNERQLGEVLKWQNKYADTPLSDAAKCQELVDSVQKIRKSLESRPCQLHAEQLEQLYRRYETLAADNELGESS